MLFVDGFLLISTEIQDAVLILFSTNLIFILEQEG